jgi:hypothetical protein
VVILATDYGKGFDLEKISNPEMEKKIDGAN